MDQNQIGLVHVVLPAYNEEQSLPPLLGRLAELEPKLDRGLRVWVVDDGSRDRTAQIARDGVPGLDVSLVQHPRNAGLGQAVQTGIRTVLNHAAPSDVVVIMDADDTHDVTLIQQMLPRLDKDCDIVIASRFVPGGDDRTAPPFRRLLSRGAAVVFRTMFPLDGFRDFTSGYRGYRAALLQGASQHWGHRLVEERGFACMVELLLKLRHWTPRISEVPLVLRYDRKGGESKLKLVRTLLQYLKLALRDRLSPPPRSLTAFEPVVHSARAVAVATGQAAQAPAALVKA